MTRKPQLLDVVELVRDVPEAGHGAGDQGTIVEMLEPADAGLVEFDPDEADLDLHAIRFSDVKVVWRVGDPLPAARTSA
jgi:hypothetical protein